MERRRRSLFPLIALTILIGSITLGGLAAFARRAKSVCGCSPQRSITRQALAGTWKSVQYVPVEWRSFGPHYYKDFTLVLKKDGNANLTFPGGSGGSGEWDLDGSCIKLHMMFTDAWMSTTRCVTISKDGKHMQLEKPFLNNVALLARS